jgi:hypothetical protein
LLLQNKLKEADARLTQQQSQSRALIKTKLMEQEKAAVAEKEKLEN